MKIKKSLEELLESLPDCSGSDYVKIVKGMQLPKSDFTEFAYWSKKSYTRNCLARTDAYELLLLCWEAGQQTPIHGHGGEECWVYVVDGKIQEERFDYDSGNRKMDLMQTDFMKTDQLSYMNDEMGFHRLRNLHSGRTMTLHLYMNPIDQCRIYYPESGRLVWKELKYHTVAYTTI